MNPCYFLSMLWDFYIVLRAFSICKKLLRQTLQFWKFPRTRVRNILTTDSPLQGFLSTTHPPQIRKGLTTVSNGPVWTVLIYSRDFAWIEENTTPGNLTACRIAVHAELVILVPSVLVCLRTEAHSLSKLGTVALIPLKLVRLSGWGACSVLECCLVLEVGTVRVNNTMESRRA